MFVEVGPRDLVVGVKYVLLSSCFCGVFTGTFKGQGNGPFHNIKSSSYYISMYNKIKHIQGIDKNISFYAFVPQKEKIQQAMEQRALDKILKRLVNDDFTW